MLLVLQFKVPHTHTHTHTHKHTHANTCKEDVSWSDQLLWYK